MIAGQEAHDVPTPAPQTERELFLRTAARSELVTALKAERAARKQEAVALREVKSLVDSQIAYLQALAKNNDLSDHGTGKLAAFMNMRDALSKPVQEPAERCSKSPDGQHRFHPHIRQCACGLDEENLQEPAERVGEEK